LLKIYVKDIYILIYTVRQELIKNERKTVCRSVQRKLQGVTNKKCLTNCETGAKLNAKLFTKMKVLINVLFFLFCL